MSGLTFPDLEEVPAVKPPPQEETKTPVVKKKPAFSMAKKRFNQMAFSVLAKIIDEKGQDEGEEEDGEGEEKGEEEGSGDAPEAATETTGSEEVPPADRKRKLSTTSSLTTPRDGKASSRRASGTLSRHGSATSIATVDSSTGSRAAGTGSKKKSKKGPSFMSVLRLANYRRKMGGKGLLGRKGAASQASSLGDLDEDDEAINDLPNQPRFCATLSTEAQYAMLKCYEDVLLDNIRSGRAVTKGSDPVPEDATLFRVKTPRDGLRLHLAGGRDTNPQQTLLPKLGEDDADGAGSVYNSKPPSRDSNRGDARVSLTGSFRLPSIPGAVRPPSSSCSSLYPPPGGRFQVVPRDKQLRLSYRFQTAMDLLDAVRDSHGELVTSRRAPKLGQINPLRNYNRWSKGWSKEFQYEYNGGPGGGMAT